MHKLNSLLKNINLLNILLIVAIIILANYTILPMLHMSIQYTLPFIKKSIGDTEEKPAESYIPSTSDYILIAEENLFHPDRKIPVEKQEVSPLPKPEFVLYGTLIADDINLAYLEDLKAPYSTPSRGKRQTALRKGDTMSGFTLKEIEAEKILMVRGEEKMEVYLNDKLRPKIREVTATVTQAAPRQPASATLQRPSALTPQVPPVVQQPDMPSEPVHPKEQAIYDFFKGKK